MRRELIFIDSGVEDYNTLIQDIQRSTDASRNIDVVILDPTRDGVEQITENLQHYENLDAVHIVSHGSEGAAQLGDTWLSSDTLSSYMNQLVSWRNALAETADLLFYGCDLAAGESGEALVDSIARLTDADVAASSDLTGSAILGGDWRFETRTGGIETKVAFSNEAQQSWQGVLASFAIDTLLDTADANPGDGVAEDESGNTSIRAAIEEANALGGADTISVGAGIFTLSLGELLITSDITITGAGVDQTFIDGDALSRVFNITCGTVTLSELTIQNGASGGGSGAGVNVIGAAIVTLDHVVLYNNTGKDGAAISNTGTLVVQSSTIDGNTATNEGGDIHNLGSATLTDTTISNNSLTKPGGGVFEIGTTTSLTNVTISGNHSADDGGGIYTVGSGVSLQNVTITDNTSVKNGGGIAESGSSATLHNVIVAGNSGSADPDLSGFFISTSDGNLIGDIGSADGLTDGVNGNQVGSVSSPINAMLGLLADNGGPSMTHALLAGSPAINSGTSTGAPATDQNGVARNDGSFDIGAFEFVVNAAPEAESEPNDYIQAVTNLTPVGYWQLNQTTSTIVVNYGSATNGTYVNGVGLGVDGAISGSSNTAVEFDGVNDYISLPHETVHLVDNGMVQLWFNADDLVGIQTLLAKDAVGFNDGDVYINLLSSGELEVHLKSTTSDHSITTSGAGINANEYYHMAFTFGDKGMELYLNGKKTGTNAYTGGITNNTNNIIVAASNSDASISKYFNGKVDEVAIFGTQVDAESIQDLYAAGLQYYTVDEDSTLDILTDAGVLANDFDANGDLLTATLVSDVSNGTLTLNADGSFSYQPDADWNGADSFTYKVNDGTVDSDIATATITVNPVNDAPVIDLNGSDGGSNNYSTIFNEGDSLISVTDSDATTSDIDNSTYNSLTMTLTGASNGTEERLRFNGVEFKATEIKTQDVTLGSTLFASVSDGTNFTINRNGGGTMPGSDLQALLRTIQYENQDNNLTSGIRTFYFVLQDADGLDSVLASSTINVGAVNDEQVLTTNTTDTVDEGSTGNIVSSSVLLTTDIDNSNAELVYNVDSVPGNGMLYLNGVALSANDTFTQADIDADFLHYDHDSSQTTSDSFNFTVDDAVGTTTSSTFNWIINSVNDNPTNAGTLPGDTSVIEDVPSNVDLSAIDLSDVDANGSELTVTLGTSSGGSLGAATGTGISISGTGSATVTLTGTLANLNTYLDTASNVTYLHSTAHTFGNDADTINVKINDNGNTGAGGGIDQY